MTVAIFTCLQPNVNQVYQQNAGYATAHNAPNGVVGATGSALVQNARTSPPALYWVGRGLVSFDTALLPGKTSARLILLGAGWAEADGGQARLHVVQGVQHIPAVAADFGNELPVTLSGGSIAFGTPAIYPNVFQITLNSDGVAMINPGGITKLCLRLDGDLLANVPGGDNHFSLATGAGNLGAGVMDIRTDRATLLGVFRGVQFFPQLEVTYDGDPLTYPRVRFEYGETMAFGNVTPWQSGVPLFSTFSATVTGLTPNTYYYYRAVAEDPSLAPYGTRYSTVSAFNTLAPPAGSKKPPTLDLLGGGYI